MAGSLGEAVLDLGADASGLVKDIDKARPAALSALSDLGRVGGALLAAGLAVAATAIVGISTLAWNSANMMDGAYDNIQTRTGATGAQLEALKKDFEGVFTSVPASAEDASTAVSILNQRLGLTGPALQGTSSSLLELTRITGGDLQTNAEAFTRLVGDWGIPLEDSALSLDKVYSASQNTGIGVDRLMQLMVQFGAPMREFGFSFDEGAAMLGKWEKEGVNTELVMGSLRIAAGNFASENVPLREGLDKAFESIKNAKTGSEALTIAMGVFGAKAGPDMTAAIREGRFELGDLVSVLGDSGGAIDDAAKSTMDWGERLTLFKNKVATSFAPAGAKMMDVASQMMNTIAEVLARPDVQQAIENITKYIGIFVDKVTEYIPIAVDGFFKFVDWLQKNKPIVVGILAAMGVAILAFGYIVAAAAWAAMSPMLPVIAIMAVIGLAAYLLYRAWTENWGGIQEKTAAVMGFLRGLLNSGLQFFANLTGGKLGIVSAIWNRTMGTIQTIVNTAVTNLKLLYKAFTQAMEGDWRGFGTSLGEIWRNVWTAFGQILTDGWANIKDIFTALVTWVFDFFTNTDWGQVGRNIISGLVDGLNGAGQWLYDAITALVNNLIDIILGAIKGAGKGGKSSTRGDARFGAKASPFFEAANFSPDVSRQLAFARAGIVPVLSRGATGVPADGGVSNVFYAPVTFRVDERQTFDDLMRKLRS